MTANDGALEHPQGFFAVYNGAGNFNADRLLEHWGDPFDLADPGIAFKRHPCCGSTHPAVDAMLHLRETHGLVAGARRQGRILDASAPARTHQPARSAERPRRQVLDPIRARARADARHRQHGAFHRRRRARSGDARADGARACRARSGGEAARPATTSIAGCKITTTAGESVRAFQDRPIGRDKDHPLPAGALEAKFRDCAKTRARRESGRNACSSGVSRLRRLPDVVRRARRHRGRRHAAGARTAQPRLCMT